LLQPCRMSAHGSCYDLSHSSAMSNEPKDTFYFSFLRRMPSLNLPPRFLPTLTQKSMSTVRRRRGASLPLLGLPLPIIAIARTQSGSPNSGSSRVSLHCDTLSHECSYCGCFSRQFLPWQSTASCDITAVALRDPVGENVIRQSIVKRVSQSVVQHQFQTIGVRAHASPSNCDSFSNTRHGNTGCPHPFCRRGPPSRDSKEIDPGDAVHRRHRIRQP
jgi:hypothetical protein